jgi:3,4-dihydroxy 2-butanone 4-phosphate synthase/GTP cyclohydrolase II
MNFVLAIRTPSLAEVPTIRIHSSCIFSEVFGSKLCDCAEQLHASLNYIREHGGILFYLDQEGRGHGIHEKTRELKLQETGLDTVEASEALRLNVDARDYRVVSDILKEMGISSVKIMTNNPRKISALEKDSISIAERIALEMKANKFNKRYLAVKKSKLGHMLANETVES